jgi:predicted nucleic acid-binding protein
MQRMNLILPKNVDELKAHKEKLVNAIAVVEQNSKKLDDICDENVTKIVGSKLFEQRLGGVDCSKIVSEYDDKNGTFIVMNTEEPAADDKAKEEGEGQPQLNVKEHEARIRADTAK